jgi:hypothetical protein
VGKVAGCLVTEGVARRSAGVRLLRDNVVIHEGTLKTLKRFKDEVSEVQSGQECGMAFENYEDVRPATSSRSSSGRRSSVRSPDPGHPDGIQGGLRAALFVSPPPAATRREGRCPSRALPRVFLRDETAFGRFRSEPVAQDRNRAAGQRGASGSHAGRRPAPTFSAWPSLDCGCPPISGRRRAA